MRNDDEPVRVVDYDPAWPARFAAERALLEETIGSWITGGIHHVGSTAVPGLAAKPVIDILVGVEDLPSTRAGLDALAAIGYVYVPYRVEVMHWLCKPNRMHRTHHLHLVPTGSERFRAELEFRDSLRSDPGLAASYAALKRELAVLHRHDRDAYTKAKQGFIASVVARSSAR